MNFTASSRRYLLFAFSILGSGACSAAALNSTVGATDVDTIFAGGFELGETVEQPGPCDGFYSDSFTLDEGELSPTLVELPKPDKGVVLTEPSMGTCMVRATIHDVEPPVTFARNDYSRRESFNSDDSMLLVNAGNGFWHVYDANSLAYIKELDDVLGDAEPQWDRTDPNSMYYIPRNGGTQIRKLNVAQNTHTVVANLTTGLPSWAAGAAHIWTRSEGSPSADQRYWGFQIEDGDFNTLGFMVWDLQQNQLVGTMQETSRPDHVSMTPSGRWFTSSSDSDGTWAWSPDFTQKKKLHHKSEHSDLAVGVNGHDMYVSIDYETNYGDVFFTDIDDCPAVPATATDAPMCPRTVLFGSYVNGSTTGMHFSGKAFDNPGWVLIGTYGTNPSRDGTYPWFRSKLFAMELNAQPRVYELGFHRGVPDGYWTEPHASPDRTLSRLMFNTNWGVTTTTDVDDYMIQLPPGGIPPANP
jgi:hypothetical protein